MYDVLYSKEDCKIFHHLKYIFIRINFLRNPAYLFLNIQYLSVRIVKQEFNERGHIHII